LPFIAYAAAMFMCFLVAFVVCLSVRPRKPKLQIRNWWNLLWICYG